MELKIWRINKWYILHVNSKDEKEQRVGVDTLIKIKRENNTSERVVATDLCGVDGVCDLLQLESSNN